MSALLYKHPQELRDLGSPMWVTCWLGFGVLFMGFCSGSLSRPFLLCAPCLMLEEGVFGGLQLRTDTGNKTCEELDLDSDLEIIEALNNAAKEDHRERFAHVILEATVPNLADVSEATIERQT